MRGRGNLAVLRGENEAAPDEPITKDKDGNDGDDDHTTQVIVDTSENGFILSVLGGEDAQTKHKVYLFDSKGETGPEGLIQDIIDSLGIGHKVRLQK